MIKEKEIISKAEFCKLLKKMEIGGELCIYHSNDSFKVLISRISKNDYTFVGDSSIQRLFKNGFGTVVGKIDKKFTLSFGDFRNFFNFMNKIYIFKYKPSFEKLAVCLLIKDENGKVLAVTRRDSILLGIPGGKVDGDEELIDAIIRETKEETNLNLVDLDADIKNIFTSFVGGYLCYCYILVDKVTKLPLELCFTDKKNIQQNEDGIFPTFERGERLMEDSEFNNYNIGALQAYDEYVNYYSGK